jgi:hypothetical protein
MNEDLQAMHAQLVATVLSLVQAQENATTTAEITALAHEIDEVNHRATMAGKLLFTQKTAALTDAVGLVTKARDEVDKAIADIGELNGFLTTISGFLGLVDKAIDTAKMAC